MSSMSTMPTWLGVNTLSEMVVQWSRRRRLGGLINWPKAFAGSPGVSVYSDFPIQSKALLELNGFMSLDVPRKEKKNKKQVAKKIYRVWNACPSPASLAQARRWVHFQRFCSFDICLGRKHNHVGCTWTLTVTRLYHYQGSITLHHCFPEFTFCLICLRLTHPYQCYWYSSI